MWDDGCEMSRLDGGKERHLGERRLSGLPKVHYRAYVVPGRKV